MHFTWLTPPGPYRARTCRERELTLYHRDTFLTTQGHGGPPRISDQLNAGTSSETTRIKDDTHHSRTHSFQQGEYGKDNNYDGQMIFREPWGLKLPDICLTGEENPRKTSPRKLVPTGDTTRARWVTSAHTTACSTAVDDCKYAKQYFSATNAISKKWLRALFEVAIQFLFSILSLTASNGEHWTCFLKCKPL